MKEKALEIPNTSSIDLDPHVDPTELTQPTPQKRKTHQTKREVHKKQSRQRLQVEILCYY
jgi:hypothetical protein